MRLVPVIQIAAFYLAVQAAVLYDCLLGTLYQWLGSDVVAAEGKRLRSAAPIYQDANIARVDARTAEAEWQRRNSATTYQRT